MGLAFGTGTEEGEEEEAEIYSIDQTSKIIGRVKYRL